MEELACLKGLCYAMHKIQARHVFVCNLWIDAHHLWMIKRRDKSEHVTNRWQVGVRAWLIRFGLQGKAQRIATVYGIVTEEVDGISHALIATTGSLLASESTPSRPPQKTYV